MSDVECVKERFGWKPAADETEDESGSVVVAEIGEVGIVAEERYDAEKKTVGRFAAGGQTVEDRIDDSLVDLTGESGQALAPDKRLQCEDGFSTHF